MTNYPFQARLHRGPYYLVVELAVEGGVSNIMDYVIEAAEMQCTTCDRHKEHDVRKIKSLYPAL